VVSVIIPAYRVTQTIAGTLDSVLAQTLADYEIIVVNDGSPDTARLKQVLLPYMARITYFEQENQGPSGARNTGIRAARGEYVAFLDADDQWEPECLAAQVAVLESDPSIAAVYADARIFGQTPEAGHTLMELSPSESPVTFESLVLRQCTVHVCVTMARREALLDTGLFDPAFRGTEDIDMWLRMVKRGYRIVYQRRVLGRYRRQAGSLSSNPIHMIEGFLAVLAKAGRVPDLTHAERQAIEHQCAIERARRALENGRRAFLAGDAPTAIRELAQAKAHFDSMKLRTVMLMLRVAPRLLQAFYRWRDRHVYKLTTEP
jgi:glycosyltransferase involved in cell wall biosynthesis